MSNATPTGHPRVIEDFMVKAFRELRPQTCEQRRLLAEGAWGSPGPYIKACGMSRAEDIVSVNLANPDMCGFVVNVPKSRRNVTPDQVLELTQTLNPAILSVGVFVDEDPAVILKLVADGGVDLIQLHGHEDEAYIASLRENTSASIIRAFKVEGPEDVAAAQESSADMVVLDAGMGSGNTFDWSLLEDIERKYMLAGGLNTDNLHAAIDALHPWGIDLSSGLETDGFKDRTKLIQAVAMVRMKE